MNEQYYTYVANVLCKLANGGTHRLRDYEITILAYNSQCAYDALEDVARDMIDDAGSSLLDAPLESVTLSGIRRIKSGG